MPGGTEYERSMSVERDATRRRILIVLACFGAVVLLTNLALVTATDFGLRIEKLPLPVMLGGKPKGESLETVGYGVLFLFWGTRRICRKCQAVCVNTKRSMAITTITTITTIACRPSWGFSPGWTLTQVVSLSPMHSLGLSGMGCRDWIVVELLQIRRGIYNY